MEPKFQPGDPVFAKMKGYPPWPGKVEGIADETQKKRKYHIYFYGTKQMAVCKEEYLYAYIANREKFGKPKKIKGFNESLTQMDEELSLSEAKVTLPKIEVINRINGRNNSLALNEKISSILKVEIELVNIIVEVQNCLNLEEANTNKCLELLDKLLQLEISILTIKRQPFVIHVTSNLERYTGNIDSWNLSSEEQDIFLYNANEIRLKAKQFNDKIKELIKVPDDCSFIEQFNKQVKEFNLCTARLPVTDICCLTIDPTDVNISC